MTPPPYSLPAAWDRVSRCWHEFFHADVDARTIALVRIAYAAALLLNIGNWYPELSTWFGERGVLPLEIARKIDDPDAWTLFQWLPQSEQALQICYAVFVVQAVCLLLGLFTRTSAACVFIWLVSFQNRNALILDGEDTVFRLIGFFLILMPSGTAWSLDSLLRRGVLRTPPVASSAPLAPAWGLRLLQIQVALIFFSAALCKMQGEAWIDGTALYYVARVDEFGKFPLPPGLFTTPWLVRVMTWSVIAVELMVPLLVWFRETRRSALLIALAFHLANEYTMHLFLFHWIMLAGWLAFVLPEDWEWMWRKRSALARQQ